MQLAQYIANRCSSLALANFPLLWVFAMRNEPLMWLTGWSYATFSQFHRWIARTATLLILVHAIGRTINAETGGFYILAWSVKFWYCGVIVSFLLEVSRFPCIRLIC